MTVRRTGQIVVGVTGASGGPYALRLLDGLDRAGVTVHLIVSTHGAQLLAAECDVRSVDPQSILKRASDRIVLHDFHDLASPIASGSFMTDGMVICPTSSNTLGHIASGLADNLITRAAAVMLKEARRLVLVHREMPVSAVDLDNLSTCRRAGAIICPASPGFYLHPQTIDDLVDFVVARVLDLMGIEHDLSARWAGHSERKADR
jgi:4-hydroxy-3-polyprenylbenzoate decarboxylase